MRKKGRSVYAIGTPSIIVVLIVLCLITFAALSLVSAKADNKLSKTYAESTTDYYAASLIAQEKIQKIDKRLLELWAANGNDVFLSNAQNDEILKSYGMIYEENGLKYLSFNENISDKKELNVILELHNPGENAECYKVIQYAEGAKNEWNGNESMNVFIPD